jgi:hypothetical protein
MGSLSTVASTVHSFLHAEREHAVGAERVPWRALVLLVVLPGFGYGCVMGLWNLRPLQAFYSGVKVPLLIVCTTLLALPSAYVLHAVLGLRDDFGAVVRGVLAAQATLTAMLLALAPITGVAYLSFTEHAHATMFNGLVFLAASLAGQVTLSRHYRVLVRRNPRHRITRAAWLVLYVFVAIQLAWVLRPFIGQAGMEVSFLRSDALGNAYVEITRRLFPAFTGTDGAE